VAKAGIINKLVSASDRNERPVRLKNYQQFMLIACEDQNTEPFYFESFQHLFPAETFYVKPVGTGRDPLGVVNKAIEEREKFKQQIFPREIDFVWAVFDKDDADENTTKQKRFEDAFELAKRENIKVAYSNEVFELWLLLHFSSVNSNNPIPRQTIYQLLENRVKQIPGLEMFVYEHGKEEIIDIVLKQGNETKAMQRANRMNQLQINKKPIDANPNTLVNLLVKEIREWIAYYNYHP
jgi:hypothetical protein